MFKRNKARGLSLAELMVAMAVLSIGLSGVAASLYFGHQKSQHGGRIVEATNLGRTIIELAVGRNYNDSNTTVPLDATGIPLPTSGMNDPDSANPVAIDAPPFDRSDFVPVAEPGVEPWAYLADFQRKIKVERLGAKGTPEEFLERITVTIYWSEKRGRQNVSTTAIIASSRGVDAH